MPDANQSRGEFSLIARFLSGLDKGPDVILGNGDDAAILRLAPDEELAVSVDSMLEGVHFPPDSPPAELAYRAVAAAASDLAAMGARPVAMTLALSIPDADESWLALLRSGLSDAVKDFSLPLVGGDLTRGPLTLSVQVMGALPGGKAIKRSAAKTGDILFVSGPLGDSAAGLAIIQGRIQAAESCAEFLRARFWRPRPALDLGASLRRFATAAVDVSDGLLADVGHIARASQVCVVVESGLVPISPQLRATVSPAQALDWALRGGEDYQLCFTLPQGLDAPAGCTRIGCVEDGAGVRCDVTGGRDGYRHF
ncbi:thiamine-phosphate kinase [Congregibacter variabilis]|uniref:Thiamine-monophosphate kinase n=1 Tax=Congregibacter variabilis TaxID=3081200 RepID=A0ABZ0I285_9GAMM|nr:thiamine-phosphate kinase [Congregibacter sp. IMCC43200]